MKQPALELFRSYRPLWIWLLVFLSIDVSFVLLNLIDAYFLDPQIPAFSLDEDRNLAEFSQYVKQIIMAIILLRVAILRKEIGYLFWSALLLYLFVDDAFQVHETVGMLISERLHAVGFDWIPQGFGEVVVSLAAASVLFFALGVRYLFRPEPEFKSGTNDLILLIGLLFFFGVVVDGIHVAFGTQWWSYFLLTILEEFGELVVFSLMTVYCFRLLWYSEDRKLFFVDRFVSWLYARYLVSREQV